ncbi:MAG: tetratricopeptide repeat protein [Acidobacteria bacterium]|nr:tetratricopeptide repeat protein [Acidobacteriota bacterium]
MLQKLSAQNPADSFSCYALAMEYAKSGQLEKAAEEYRKLLEINPDYAAAYFHGGQALEKLDLLEEARTLYRKGIEVTTRTGDQHARSELQAALDTLG